MQKKKKTLRLVPSNIVTKMAKKQRSSFVKIGLHNNSRLTSFSMRLLNIRHYSVKKSMVYSFVRKNGFKSFAIIYKQSKLK
jgi:hypothetical protein